MMKPIFFIIITILISSCGANRDFNFCPSLSSCSSTNLGGIDWDGNFFDDFNRANQPLTSDSNWIPFSINPGSIDIVSNAIVTNLTPGTVAATHYANVTTNNVRLSIDFKITSAAFSTTGNAVAALIARNNDNDDILNLYLCGIDELVSGTQRLAIYKPPY